MTAQPRLPLAGELLPVGARLAALYAMRLALAGIVLVAVAAAGGTVGAGLPEVAPVLAVYLVVVTAAEVARRLHGRLPRLLTGGLLLLDGVALSGLVAVTGGPASVVGFLLSVHLISATLLSSYRTGLKLALWYSLLLTMAYNAPAQLLMRPASLADAAFSISAFWAVAIASAVCSALNERALQRARANTGALADMAHRMELAPQAAEVVATLLHTVTTHLGVRRAAAVILADDTLLAARVGPAGAVGLQPVQGHLDDDAAQLLDRGGALLVRRLSPDGVLAGALPDARNVVLVALVADAQPFGVLAVERGGGAGATVAQSTVDLLGQLAAQACLAYRNACLVDEIRRMAASDGLTGVANRRTFDEALAREVARAERTGEPLSVVLLDVDHFKRINDTHGHQAGDDVLRHVGAALRAGARQADLPARYGGEEFAVILPGATAEEGLRAAERLRAAMARGAPVAFTASAGVASLPRSATTGADLVAAADQALYAAKAGGRDRTVVAEPVRGAAAA